MPPEYLAPGVVVEEIERGPKPIQAVGTSTTAFVGETQRGPLKPKLITAYNEYLRNFGDVFSDGKYMPYAVKGFFDNGGRRCFIARIVGNGATAASVSPALSAPDAHEIADRLGAAVAATGRMKATYDLNFLYNPCLEYFFIISS